MKPLTEKKGLTLIELLIAGILISLVFVAATAAFISALKFLDAVKNNRQLDALIAMEHMVRKINLSNEFVVLDDNGRDISISGQPGKEVKIRMDYQLDLFVPNKDHLGSAFDPTDDHWARYKLMSDGSLRWRGVDFASGGAAFDAGWDEVMPDLSLDAGSEFRRINPLLLEINLVVRRPDGSAITLNTSAMAHQRSNTA